MHELSSARKQANQENGSDTSASPHARRIFRSEARQHYLQNQQKIVLPDLVSARAFAGLWIVSLLLAVIGALIAFWPLI